MRPRPGSFAAVALTLALAATLAGCASSATSNNGVASKAPAQILAAARSAAAGAATVHVAGSIVREGQPISLDMELVAHKGGKGRITLGGLSAQLIELDGLLYINGGSAFDDRVAGPAAARRLSGKWLRGSADSGALASLASVTDMGELIDTALTGHGTLGRGATTTIDGQKAVGVSDLAEGGTLYVASTGAPYPLEIVTGGADGGKIAFNRWNQSVTLEAPAKVIEIDELQSHH
jgi:hypothetical protein